MDLLLPLWLPILLSAAAVWPLTRDGRFASSGDEVASRVKGWIVAAHPLPQKSEPKEPTCRRVAVVTA